MAGCAACGASLPPRKGSNGRPRKYCESCSPPRRRKPSPGVAVERLPDGSRPCAGCGSLIPPRVGSAGQPRRFCESCSPKRLRKRPPPKPCAGCGARETGTSPKGVRLKYCEACRTPEPKHCPTCGVEVRGRGKFCAEHSRAKVFAACVGCGKSMQAQAERPCCRPCGRRLTDDEKRALGLVARTPEHVCVQCGETFVRREFGPNRPAKFCSLKCKGKDQTAKADPYKNQRNMSLKRARKMAAFVEVVDPAVLFERDGWRCHLCGKKCRRDVNGLHPDAPSIDHVVPLSKGGEHSYRNTACAHRRCNTAKGARPQGEQLALA